MISSTRCRKRRRSEPSGAHLVSALPGTNLAVIVLLAVTSSSCFVRVAAEGQSHHRKTVSRTAAAPVPFGGPTLHRYRYFRNRAADEENSGIKNSTVDDSSPPKSQSNKNEKDHKDDEDPAEAVTGPQRHGLLSEGPGWGGSPPDIPTHGPMHCGATFGI